MTEATPPKPRAPGARTTLLDVAQRAGVSRTTASFVMTGRRDMRISADAEERVRRAARELNYRPSLLARSLRTNQSQTLGLLSDEIATEAFAGEVIRGSLSTALLHDHLLFVGETEGDSQVEQSIIQSMLDRGVGGFVYASMYTRKVSISKILRAQQLVLLNCLPRVRGVTAVVPHEREAGRQVARLLLEHGHRDGIALVGEQATHVHASAERLSGITEVLEDAGVVPVAEIDCLWWPGPSFDAVSRFLQDRTAPRVTALICLNDRVAMGAYQAAAEAGLRIPQDLSIVSFDNSDLAAWLRPGLTSVSIPHFEMGRRAVELLLDKDRPTTVEQVPMPVFHRDSVAVASGR